MMSARPAAVILAGGRATRMGGGDKGARLLAGKSLHDHVIARLAPQCGPMALNANGDPERFAALGLPVLPDSLPGHPGPLAGVLAAMDWAAGLGLAGVITVPSDTPFLPVDLAFRLTAATGLTIAASRDRGGQLHEHPTCGYWPLSLRGDLRRSLKLGQRRVRGFAREHGAGLVVWDDIPHDPFLNINTPEDLARAQAFVHAKP
ncbi:molybdenum cofactor guanylyltransferase MobA [Paracoccus sp. (in: a-proteobacteria)]|uniref:molybdenum cofactor guanylyltransferase MobA n=1 Tax=Paracoccus sp. TaxID=267 RepID=UPI003A89BB8B